MEAFALIVAILLPLLLAGAFLLGRRLHDRPFPGEHFSAVTRQHFEIFQSGLVNEAAVEEAKRRFRVLLERGEVATVEASLRPGMTYVFKVRALTEIGTETAGRILERQLHHRLSDDRLEQAWYWIDLASSLRSLQREESLPHLLRCADSAVEVPLGHFFAAETISFLGFAGYLSQPESPQGRSALRLLHRAIEGLRYGVQPHLVTEARLGELLENLWDHQPRHFDPLLVRVVHEALRFLRRAPHAQASFGEDGSELEAFNWQLARLTALETSLIDFLGQAAPALKGQLRWARDGELSDLLHALQDLRVDAGKEVLSLVDRPGFPQLDLAIEVMTWSKNPQVASWLRSQAFRCVAMENRAKARPRPAPPRKSSVPPTVPYRNMLRALKGHPSPETEKFLMLAARDWDPTFRGAALGSLGWWEPWQRAEILACLEEGRRDPSSEVRQTARAALARLGERQALHWFRQALTSEDSSQLHEVVQVIAAEHLMLLWPDLDRLADSDQPEIAYHAHEALERMCEEMDRSH